MPNRHLSSRPQSEGGLAIISVLFGLLVMSVLLLGVATLASGHQTRASADSNYAAAMDLAEAGVDWEYSQLSANVNNADKTARTVSTPFGVANTSFTVQCVNRGTTTAWSGPGTNLDVLSTGTINGTWRQVRVSSKAYNQQGLYALFGINTASIQGHVSVQGDLGTDGAASDGGSSTITGNVYLDGSGASFSGSGVTVITNPNALVWPTVDQIALSLFPSTGATAPGGLAYLATNNDNAKAGLPTSGATLSGGETLIGPGNYYVTSISVKGNKSITMNNTAGVINIWVGPSDGSGSVDMGGCTRAVTTDASQGGYPINMYVATTGGTTLHGTTQIYLNVYAYDVDSSGNAFGSVTDSGTPDIWGSIIAYSASLNGNPGIHYVNGGQTSTGVGYYGYDNSWSEVTPR